MNAKYIKEKQIAISSLISTDRLPEAIDLMIDLAKKYKLDDVLNEILLKKANNVRLNKEKRLGIHGANWDQSYNSLIFTLLEILDSLSGKALEIITREQIKLGKKNDSNSNYIFELSTYAKDIANLSEEDIENLYRAKAKAYKEIFERIEDKIDEKKEFKTIKTSLLFKRISSYDKINKADLHLIYEIRRSEKFRWYERSLIVSSLSLSVLNRFDITRIELLLDFVFDFEENVWEKALFGVIIGANKYDKRLDIYPKVVDKIKRLSAFPDVIDGVKTISFYLENRIYSEADFWKLYREKSYDIQAHVVFSLMGSFLGIDKKRLYEEVRLFELLPFEIGVNEFGFLENPQNWFLPFFEKNQVLEFLKDNTNRNVNLKLIEDKLNTTRSLSDFSKYIICLHFEKLPASYIKNLESDVDTARIMFNLTATDEDKKELNNEFPEEENLTEEIQKGINNIYLSTIRDFYRFFNLFPSNSYYNFFKPEVKLHESIIAKYVLGARDSLMLEIETKLRAGDYEAVFIKSQDFFEKHGDEDDIFDIYTWACFCTGRFEIAKKNFLSIIEKGEDDDKLMHSYMNVGHIELSSQKEESAISYYRKSLKLSEPVSFQKEYKSDYEHIKKYVDHDYFISLLPKIGCQDIDINKWENFNMNDMFGELESLFTKISELIPLEEEE